MKRTLLALVVFVVSLVGAQAQASNGMIYMYTQNDGNPCDITVPGGPPAYIYVYARLYGATVDGITGVEFKIQEGLNNNADLGGYMFSETFDPSATVLGLGAFSPVDPAGRGVTIAWPTCQQGTNVMPYERWVLIETVAILNPLGSTAEMKLLAVKSDFYSNEYFKCPLFVLCDAPVYTKVCTGYTVACAEDAPPSPPPLTSLCSTSGYAYINSPYGCHCCVGVTQSTWSQVKSLYKGN
jgi:hypothetical protein